MRSYRRRAGLTQEDLAEQAGVSVRLLAYLEGGKHLPRPTTARQLVNALALSDEERMQLLAGLEAQAAALTPPREYQSSLPSAGLHCFLITDLRGYTRFTQERGDEAAARLTMRFAGIVRDVVGVHGGEVLELRGDEALCVFSSARATLRAAIALQAHLREVTARDPSLPLMAGIGLDVGEAVPIEGGYRGSSLNLAARLSSLAGPGETLCSQAIAALVPKSEGVVLVDRGEVSLKGFESPVGVRQVGAEGELPAVLPPLQAVVAAHPTNLPDAATSFIGREREIEAVTQLLDQPYGRLVTLTGPGGTGKTRLALQVAESMLYAFRDGVFLVPLASLDDPALVPAAIAEALGVREEPGTATSDSLIAYLKDKEVLLLVDNYEHLLDAALVIASLLDACRELRVLATSRIPLHLSREREYAVPPLSFPDPADVRSPEDLAQCEAVSLFLARAQAVRADFALTESNATAVAAICARLDGLPLALELAATRIKLFPPHALLHRLDDRFRLLSGGARDLPRRQQTLRAAIDWSYSLLSEEEQRLLARLSVFAGGCTVEAAEEVCSLEGDVDVLEGLISLTDQSLLRQEGEDEPRYTMLETIRDYAAEKLREQRTIDRLRERHAAFYLRMAAEAAAAGYDRANYSGPWRQRLELEHANLRSVFAYLLGAGRIGDAVELVDAVRLQWFMHGYGREVRLWVEDLIRISTNEHTDVRMKALTAGAWLAAWYGEREQALARAEQAKVLAREMGDTATLLGLRDVEARALGDMEPGRAVEILRDNLRVGRQQGEKEQLVRLLNNLAVFLLGEEDRSEARVLLAEALALARETGLAGDRAAVLNNAAFAALLDGDSQSPRGLLHEALDIFERDETVFALPGILRTTAVLATVEGDLQPAAWLHGASDALLQRLGGLRPSPVLRAHTERWEASARERLGEAEWQQKWNEGQRASQADVVVAVRAYLEPS